MMILVQIVGLLIILSASATNTKLQNQWEEYKLKHGKVYENAETEQYRFQLWSETARRVEKHNKRYEAGEVKYSLGLNKMSDLTLEEKRQLGGFLAKNKKMTNANRIEKLENQPRPEKVDWRKKGAVTPVKNQGKNCKSCWTFSAVAAVEGQYFLKYGKLVSFSEQQLVDCVQQAQGCDGGLMDLAFAYLQENGLETEETYPYQAQTLKCRHDQSKATLANLTSFIDLPSGDEKSLQDAIAFKGPISVALATVADFYEYSCGVYESYDCGKQVEDLNLGVTAVGYGTTEDGYQYYLLKNSWGQDWGEQGFVRIRRNEENMCGIATAASYPQL